MANIKIDKIIRSKRKTIALQITSDATLIVRAPELVTMEVIHKVIAKEEQWIRKKQEYIRHHLRRPPAKEFVNGEGFLFMGHDFKLHIIDNQKSPLYFDNAFYLSRKYLPVAKEIFTNWYKAQAKEKIAERVHWYAAKAGLKFEQINITNARKRWGSCSHNGNLSFSWRLIMVPLQAIDYVVVHELAHLEERNHSNQFWNKVKVMLTNYEKYREWFKENERNLNI